jgi:DNA-directed RNA polymerase subunit RPC12/RpoP
MPRDRNPEKKPAEWWYRCQKCQDSMLQERRGEDLEAMRMQRCQCSVRLQALTYRREGRRMEVKADVNGSEGARSSRR